MVSARGFLADLGRRSDAARDVAEDIGRRVTDELRTGRGSDARAELARLWRQVEDLVENRAAPAASRAARSAEHYLGEGREYAVEAAERLREAARARPLLAIGIAVAATFAIASLIGVGRGRDRRR
jgi:hypothetical protein